MLMMHVGHMRMSVNKWLMLMPMRVWFTRWIVRPVNVLVMLVMNVRVGMSPSSMDMLVLVTLREVKPHPETHECASGNQLHCNWLAERKDRRSRAEEGCG